MCVCVCEWIVFVEGVDKLAMLVYKQMHKNIAVTSV